MWPALLVPLWLLSLIFLPLPKKTEGIVTAALCAAAEAGLIWGAAGARRYLNAFEAENIRLCFGVVVMGVLLFVMAAAAVVVSFRKTQDLRKPLV